MASKVITTEVGLPFTVHTWQTEALNFTGTASTKRAEQIKRNEHAVLQFYNNINIINFITIFNVHTYICADVEIANTEQTDTTVVPPHKMSVMVLN